MADNSENKAAKTEKKTPKNDKKTGKSGFMAKVSKFFRDYRSELKKISWPTFSEVVKNTIVTLVTVLIVGVFIWIIDYAFGQVRNLLLNLSDKETGASQVQEIEGTDELDEALQNLTGEIEETGEAAAEEAGEVAEAAVEEAEGEIEEVSEEE